MAVELLPLLEQPFHALTQRERLFLYLVRNWGKRAARGDRRPSSYTNLGTNREASLDQFLRSFAEALPEPLMLKPPRCRCSIQFHEATLLAFFRCVRAGDRAGWQRTLGDLMPVAAIERLACYLQPTLGEIDLALEELNQPPAGPSPANNALKERSSSGLKRG